MASYSPVFLITVHGPGAAWDPEFLNWKCGCWTRETLAEDSDNWTNPQLRGLGAECNWST